MEKDNSEELAWEMARGTYVVDSSGRSRCSRLGRPWCKLDPVLSLSLEVRGWNCGEADEEGKQ